MAENARSSHDKAASRALLEGYVESSRGLRGGVCRIVVLQRHTLGLARMVEIVQRAEHAEECLTLGDPNGREAQVWGAVE